MLAIKKQSQKWPMLSGTWENVLALVAHFETYLCDLCVQYFAKERQMITFLGTFFKIHRARQKVLLSEFSVNRRISKSTLSKYININWFAENMCPNVLKKFRPLKPISLCSCPRPWEENQYHLSTVMNYYYLATILGLLYMDMKAQTIGPDNCYRNLIIFAFIVLYYLNWGLLYLKWKLWYVFR